MEKKEAGNRRVKYDSRTMVHRKAAALAWYKHGRTGNFVSGSGKRKTQNSFSCTFPVAHRERTRLTCPGEAHDYSPDEMTQLMDIGNGIHVPVFQNLCSTLHHHGALVQASRFKAEAITLQSSCSSSSSSSFPSSCSSASTSPPHATPDLNNRQLTKIRTGRSSAHVNLLRHQPQKRCFMPEEEYGDNASSCIQNDGKSSCPWDSASSPYDSFELLRLSNQLSCCLSTVNAKVLGGSPRAVAAAGRLFKAFASPSSREYPAERSYIPRSLHVLPQFTTPSLAKKAVKKRSSLIHPLFYAQCYANASSVPLPTPSDTRKSHGTEDRPTRRSVRSGFRSMFNNLLKALHAKDDPAHYKPKRLNLSEELEKLPMLSDTVDLFPETMPPPEGIANGLTPTFRFSSSATAGEATNRRTTWESPSIAFSSPPAASMAPNRPSTSSSLTSMFVFPSYSTGAIATDRPSTSSSPSPISLFASSTATLPSDRSSTTFGSHMTPKLASKRLSGSVPAHRHHHHNFQKEGFRTTSIRPTKSVTKHTETPRPVAH